MKKILFLFGLLSISLIIKSCIDPFEITNVSYEEILIVEGKLTNELKKHEIYLSKTIKINDVGVSPEKDAVVYITDNTNEIFNFSEIEIGRYQSINSFIPENNKTYTLNIETSNGKHYKSNPQQLTGLSDIGDINILIDENNIGEEELNINVNSITLNEDTKYYYYEYEEAFKIIAPYWNVNQFDMTNYPDIAFTTKPLPYKDICYKTQYSSGSRIQTETLSLSDNKVVNFSIRSIATDNYILSYRYSILIKQFVQTQEAYSYHESLNSFADYESVFSENQVGFLNGNIFNTNDNNEKVIGFFEVNSVTSKRIFFNREDFFEDPITTYATACNPFAPELLTDDSLEELLILHRSGNYLYYSRNTSDENAPYNIVPKACGDCTEIGSINKPDFWID